jgi:hypothetical protein
MKNSNKKVTSTVNKEQEAEDQRKLDDLKFKREEEAKKRREELQELSQRQKLNREAAEEGK